MGENVAVVYQSGETVPETGTYEVVAAEEGIAAEKHGAVQDFEKGDTFPDYEGRAVQWHLQGQAESAATSG
jgi:hypothetical protein